MWIFLSDSFLSIIEDLDNPNNLMVRARIEGDIERVFPGAAVTHTPDHDYYYRTSLPKKDVAARIAEKIAAIDYHNFKNSVKERERHDAYFDVWEIMQREGDRRI